MPASTAESCAETCTAPTRAHVAGVPVLDADDVDVEPTVRDQLSFEDGFGDTVQARPRTLKMTPLGAHAQPAGTSAAPLPPHVVEKPPARVVRLPTATRAVAFGIAIGAAIGSGLAALAWHFVV